MLNMSDKVLNLEFVPVDDILRETNIKVKMLPLHFSVVDTHTTVTFHTKSEDNVLRFYCTDDNYASESNVSHPDITWTLNLPVNDQNTMLLLLNRGVLCKAVTNTHIFPFLIYSHKHWPNVKPVIFKNGDKILLHTKHHWWVQGLTLSFTFISVLWILIFVLCCSQKRKYV